MRNLGTTHGLVLGVSLLLGGPALLATTACGSLGDRAVSGCPTGEVCNPDTPDGLRFFGASLAGTLSSSPGAVAVGGHQAIRFEDATHAFGTLPAHTVVSSNAAVLSAASTGAGAAALGGVSAGSADVRVVDAENRLLDRLTISVGVIDHVDVIATDDLLIAIAEAQSHAPVVFAAGSGHAGVALMTATGGRLIDDAASITSSAAINHPSWDTVEATFGTSDVPLTVHAGGRSFDVVVHVAGAVDDFELVTALLGSDTAGQPQVGASDSVCVIFRSGGARVVGGTLAATFRVDGTATAADTTGHCVTLPSSGLGATVAVQASLGSAVRTFTIAVDPMRRTTAMPLVSEGWVLPRIVPTALGERARLAWGID